MKKTLTILATIVALGAAAWFVLPGMLSRTVAGTASADVGIPFTLGDMSFNPFAGRASLTDVILESEDPFESPHAVRVDRVEATFDASTVLSPFIVVNNVVVTGVDVRIEQRGGRINVRELARKMEAYLAEADTTEQARVFVHEFRIEGARGKLVTDAGEREFQIRDVTLRDLGSESSGTPVQVIAANVIEPLLTQALQDAGLGAGGLRDRLGRLFGRD
ncbi:MAG: hypothetical protein HKN29_07370 [Rhodothermales bacterium]|nr:hypothetical protein [Rhodothermales bacterium]